MAEVVIKQIEEGMTGRQVADLLYSNFLALVGAIGSGGGGDIPVADIEKGVTAYGWGDHRQAGYLKGITAGMVTGALGYIPLDEAAWTKANIKATLGIADWALAASKPTYKTSEVAEDGNLYFTDARAVAALAGVTDALAGDIGVLQGYFTNGVAKSAAKLQTARKLWGQLFNGEADVTGALTGVTDITASGTLTIGKIKIGDGVIEWDAANGGFKVTGGLWATDYLSSKGVNTGASGGGSSYQRLDTWDGYTTAKDGWVLSAKLGYGLKTTQDDILRQLADISGQGTNVTFTPALTSGTQIGALTIDGEPVKMYAPSIPTSDIEKGVTAYGWGDHSKAGYLTSASSLAWGKITGTPTTISGYGITDALTALTSSSDTNLSITVGGTTKNVANLYARYTERFRVVWNNPSEGTYDLNDLLGGYVRAYGSGGTLVNAPESFGHGAILSLTNGTKALSGQLAWNIKHGNTTDVTKNLYWRVSDSANGYTYAKWHQIAFTDYVDTKLSGYLPLSGGMIRGVITLSGYEVTNVPLNILTPSMGYTGYIRFGAGTSTNEMGHIGFSAKGIASILYEGMKYDIIHSGNIGSQSVSYATSAGDADTLDGMQGSLYKRLKGAENLGASAENLVDLNTTTVFNTYSSTTKASDYISNKPYTGNRGFQMEVMCQLGSSANYVRQILYAYGTNNIYTRYSNDKGVGWSSWEQFAYLTSNVASATKLQTSRKIWGQSFDGTGDVSGAIKLGTNVIYGDGNKIVLEAQSGAIHIGYGYRELPIYHYGGLFCFNSGNVLIGTSTDSGYKLDVNGTLYASNAVTLGGTAAATANLAFSRSSYNYITFPTDGSLCLSTATSTSGIVLRVTRTAIEPMTTATKSVGTSSKRWGAIYGVDGDFSGTLHATTGIWSDGYVSAKGQNTTSDMRLKRVLEEVTLSVDEIAAAPAFRFEWKGGGGVDVGTSAQYWEKLVPDAVKRDDAGWRMMQYGNVAMVALISLARRVKDLEEQLKIKN